jgi:hypothetical protein
MHASAVRRAGCFVPRFAATSPREDELRLRIELAAFVHHRLRDLVQYDQPILPVFHQPTWHQENRRAELGQLHFPLPPQLTHLLLAGAGVDLEERHLAIRVGRQFREQQILLFP